MKLDVVLPTYKRTPLLRKALSSLLHAPVPAGLDVTIYVIDNNSKDDTAQVVAEIAATAALPVEYVLETRQGLSHARNRGIESGTGELIGFIDDDEEIEPQWYSVIAREFADRNVEYIGGPCLPNWVTDVPDWLPPGYHSVIGAIPPKPRAAYGPEFSGILNGGNAVVRRSVFERVGGYSVRLGRSGKGLLSEEDAELYRRLQAAEIRGVYVPDLAILHYIAPDRLTRSYHRRWVYWRAASHGVLDREQPEQVKYLFGIPRHRLGYALRSLLRIPKDRVSANGKARAFADQLSVIEIAGFVYGKYFMKLDSHYGK